MPHDSDRLTVAVSGASGLVGSPLVAALKNRQHTVLRLVRKDPQHPDEIHWDAESGQIESEKLAGVDAIVHLAGESIAAGRWTAGKKLRIRESRVKGTRSIAEALAALETPPRVFASASAIGFYGDRGADQMDETANPGDGFLVDVCRDWEAATQTASAAGIRTVMMRLGVVLSASGGALAKMLPPFKLGIGGRLGSGKQYFSWISIDDAVDAIQFILQHDTLQGPVNLVAPNPVTNRELTKALGRVIRRPTFFPMPTVAAKLVFGEMAEEMLLASTRVIPARLTEAGFSFQHPELEPALHELLAR